VKAALVCPLSRGTRKPSGVGPACAQLLELFQGPTHTRSARPATHRRIARAGPRLAAGTRARRPLCGGVRARRHESRGRAARRRRLGDDAAVPLEYQGREAITLFLEDRVRLRGAPLRLVPTAPTARPALGTYLDDRYAPVARPFSFPRADARRRTDLGDHRLHRRHERLRALRIAAQAPSRLAPCETDEFCGAAASDQVRSKSA
jgi:hypothetical protein